jgi:hypothetical protein
MSEFCVDCRDLLDLMCGLYRVYSCLKDVLRILFEGAGITVAFIIARYPFFSFGVFF